MNINRIKEIVNAELLPDDIKRSGIIAVLADDKEAIHDVLYILDVERRKAKELILDMNLELSRAHIYIDERPEAPKESKQSFNKGFILDEISKFYIRYKGVISHCFNRFT